MNKVQAAVKRGATLLDQKKKRWAFKISVPELDMSNGRYCVLGQVYADDPHIVASASGYSWESPTNGYYAGMKKLFGNQHSDEGHNYGFDGRDSLRRYWLVEIGRRLVRRA